MTVQEIQDLQAAVAAETSVDTAAVKLITGFAATLQASLDRATAAEAAGVAKDAALAQLRADIEVQVGAVSLNTIALAAAVAANTPAETPAPPAPTPVFGVSPTSISVDASHAPLALTVTTADGSTPSFVSRDPSVATVDASGVVTPVAPGDTFIDITAGADSASIEVIVLAS